MHIDPPTKVWSEDISNDILGLDSDSSSFAGSLSSASSSRPSTVGIKPDSSSVPKLPGPSALRKPKPSDRKKSKAKKQDIKESKTVAFAMDGNNVSSSSISTTSSSRSKEGGGAESSTWDNDLVDQVFGATASSATAGGRDSLLADDSPRGSGTFVRRVDIGGDDDDDEGVRSPLRYKQIDSAAHASESEDDSVLLSPFHSNTSEAASLPLIQASVGAYVEERCVRRS